MAAKIVVFPSLSTHIPVKFADSTKCTTIDVSKDTATGRVTLVEGKVDEAALPVWLNKETGDLDLAEELPGVTHGLEFCQMVPLERNENDNALFALTKKSFGVVSEHFSLRERFISIMTNQHTKAFSHPATQIIETSSDILLFKGRFHPIRFFQLVMKYVPKTYTTHALLVFDPQYNSPEIKNLIPSLHSDMGTCSHPLVLPLYLAKEHIDHCAARIHDQNCKLDEMQIMTGQYSSDHYVPAVDLLMLEFTEMTRLLNSSAEVTTHQVFTLKGFATTLPVLKAWGISLSQLNSGGEDRDAFLVEQELMLDELEYLRGVIVASLIHAEHVEKRIETYRQLVYQLMAQKDSKTNIELAKSSAAIAKASKEDGAVMRQIALETKKDSSAMKTIAMLTMFFLPGTFVAAIFAMPVFEWDGSGSPVFRSGFKRYWAITVPLTVTVFLLWGAATILPWRSWLFERYGKTNVSMAVDGEGSDLEGASRR